MSAVSLVFPLIPIMSGPSVGGSISINDVKLPPNLVKDHSVQVLKELIKQDEATFFEYFEGLNLEDVRQLDT